jgi:hypothetical protein
MKISPSNSHTHCQVAPAQAQTKTWQRVCLSNRTSRTTDNPTDEKEHRSDNSTYTQVGVQCFYESEVLNQSSVLLMKFSAKNPHLRVAAKRCMQG